jgi:hypothetical protein
MAQMASIFAELESSNIGTRVSSARSYLSKQGYFSGGRVPFGYQLEKDDGHNRLVPNPEEAELIHQMIDRVLAGETARAVARWLNDEGVPSRLGRDWTGPSVKTLLTGRPITGHTKSQGHLVTGDDGLPIQTHPPIISMGVHKRICDTFDSRKTTRTRRNGTAASSPLHGVVFCECGRQMSFCKVDKRGSFAYKCHCNLKIGAKKLEECVIPGVVMAHHKSPIVTSREAPVEDDFEARVNDLTESFARGAISLEVFEMSVAAMERQRPKPTKGVSEEFLFRRWNELSVVERAMEMRRVVKVHVRNGEDEHSHYRSVKKEIFIERLVDGLVDPWTTPTPHGEVVPVTFFDEWIDPKKFTSLDLLLPDGGVRLETMPLYSTDG